LPEPAGIGEVHQLLEGLPAHLDQLPRGVVRACAGVKPRKPQDMDTCRSRHAANLDNDGKPGVVRRHER
jgi:hypothetical protein